MQFETRDLAGTPAGSEIARGERASLERSHQSARALPSHSSGFTRACVRVHGSRAHCLSPTVASESAGGSLSHAKRFVLITPMPQPALVTRDPRVTPRALWPLLLTLSFVFCFVFVTVQTQPTSLTCSHLSIPACRLFT